jgi:hypothetical protein
MTDEVNWRDVKAKARRRPGIPPDAVVVTTTVPGT